MLINCKNNLSVINLFIWGDSLCFRRPFQPDNYGFTYPFLIKKALQQKIGVDVNLMVRSLGGLTIIECCQLVKRDSGYLDFRNDTGVLNVAILQVGVVDCAPLPFTYPFMKIFEKIPYIGNQITGVLKKLRPTLQNIYSKPKTSKKIFLKNYSEILNLLGNRNFIIVGVGIPTPNNEIEQRSPGFQKSAKNYSTLIEEMNENYVDIEGAITSQLLTGNEVDLRDKIIIKEDGHHLTEAGHILYSEMISESIINIINCKPPRTSAIQN